MRIEFYLEPEENYTNIGIAKAMTETDRTAEDLLEISDYLRIYARAEERREYRNRREG